MKEQYRKECEPCHPTSPECDYCGKHHGFHCKPEEWNKLQGRMPNLSERLSTVNKVWDCEEPITYYKNMADEAKKAFEELILEWAEEYQVHIDELIERIKKL